MELHPQKTNTNTELFSLRWQKLSTVIILFGIFLFLGFHNTPNIYVAPNIYEHLDCSDNSHCLLTIRNNGGGFDHGFNPQYTWSIAGDSAANLQFRPASGTIAAHHSEEISITLSQGSCPQNITVTSHVGLSISGTAIYSGFVYNPQTQSCSWPYPQK